MRFRIRHPARYEYPEPASLCHNLARLRPPRPPRPALPGEPLERASVPGGPSGAQGSVREPGGLLRHPAGPPGAGGGGAERGGASVPTDPPSGARHPLGTGPRLGPFGAFHHGPGGASVPARIIPNRHGHQPDRVRPSIVPPGLLPARGSRRSDGPDPRRLRLQPHLQQPGHTASGGPGAPPRGVSGLRPPRHRLSARTRGCRHVT